jgi:hypothetical protein
VQIVSAAFDDDVEVGFDWLGCPLNAAESALGAEGTVALSGGQVVRVTPVTGHVAHVAP